MAIRFTDATPVLQLPPLPATLQARAGPKADVDVDVDVWIDPDVEQQVRSHLQALDVEQGGLLVGQAYAHPETGAVAHVRILKCAPATDASGTAFSLRMGTGVWQAAQALLSPGEMIVGWYHSHPGLTAFFSDTDRQTQRAFFNHPYSVGWVIDPVGGQEALFLGGECAALQRGPDRLLPLLRREA